MRRAACRRCRSAGFGGQDGQGGQGGQLGGLRQGAEYKKHEKVNPPPSPLGLRSSLPQRGGKEDRHARFSLVVGGGHRFLLRCLCRPGTSVWQRRRSALPGRSVRGGRAGGAVDAPGQRGNRGNHGRNARCPATAAARQPQDASATAGSACADPPATRSAGLQPRAACTQERPAAATPTRILRPTAALGRSAARCLSMKVHLARRFSRVLWGSRTGPTNVQVISPEPCGNQERRALRGSCLPARPQHDCLPAALHLPVAPAWT